MILGAADCTVLSNHFTIASTNARYRHRGSCQKAAPDTPGAPTCPTVTRSKPGKYMQCATHPQCKHKPFHNGSKSPRPAIEANAPILPCHTHPQRKQHIPSRNESKSPPARNKIKRNPSCAGSKRHPPLCLALVFLCRPSALVVVRGLGAKHQIAKRTSLANRLGKGGRLLRPFCPQIRQIVICIHGFGIDQHRYFQAASSSRNRKVCVFIF